MLQKGCADIVLKKAHKKPTTSSASHWPSSMLGKSWTHHLLLEVGCSGHANAVEGREVCQMNESGLRYQWVTRGQSGLIRRALLVTSSVPNNFITDCLQEKCCLRLVEVGGRRKGRERMFSELLQLHVQSSSRKLSPWWALVWLVLKMSGP